jgi:hypothetical protein
MRTLSGPGKKTSSHEPKFALNSQTFNPPKPNGVALPLLCFGFVNSFIVVSSIVVATILLPVSIGNILQGHSSDQSQEKAGDKSIRGL